MKKFVALSLLSLSVLGCSPDTSTIQQEKPTGVNQNIGQILMADSKYGNIFVERNVAKSKAFKMVEHQGEVAARIHLSTSMGGARDDWYRNGVGGFGQRFEYGQRKETAQRFNKEIWTRIVFWLPEGTVADAPATIFDLKEIRNNQTFGPLLNLSVRGEGLSIKHQFKENDCIIGRDGNGENSFCDKTDTMVFLGGTQRYTGRWVEYVSRAVWSNDTDGIYDAWIDGRKVIGYRGNTSFGADRIAFKFGLYRIRMNEVNTVRDLEIYFSKVGTASTCETLEITNCGLLYKTQNVMGYPSATKVFEFEINQKTDFINSGGRVLKRF